MENEFVSTETSRVGTILLMENRVLIQILSCMIYLISQHLFILINIIPKYSSNQQLWDTLSIFNRGAEH